MKTLALLTTLAFIAAGAAHAGSTGEEEYNEHNRSQFTSSMTRAQVQAQLAEAVESGTMASHAEDSGSFAINQQAGSSRDIGAVREEAIIAARSPKIQELMV